MRNRTVMPTLILSAVLAGCGGDPSGASPLTPAEFVEVVVEIREAEGEVAAEDDAGRLFEERRREILDRHGTTEAELRAFLTANAGNLAVLEQVWDTINARLTRTAPSRDAVGEEEGFAPDGFGDERREERREELGEGEGGDDPPGPARRVVPLNRDGFPRPDIR